MLPSISLITPSYNQGPYIRKTVESVLNQAYPALEYLVVDGQSSDGTLPILREYSHRLRLISEPDRGQTDALNKGLRAATGDIVGWLNSDDYLLPGALHEVGRFFEQHPDVSWLTGDCLIVDKDGRLIQQPIREYKRILRKLSPSFYLGITNAICQPATFWRRSLHDRLGYLNENLRYTMDYDWWLRLAQLQPPAVLAKPLAAFRIHGASKGGSQFTEQFDEDYRTLIRHRPADWVRLLHRAHNEAIVGIYKLIK
ncbi:glycosyltransferase family 2 protein [Tellurirhabdus rosea]|uniref:glycosyltransferase family 2 protein n=1 Tax=Tellurirhabdus rosea TaxID=2674997 RepID=UPI00225B73D4|nr:glycosyltransferase family 2 protein [Tellurirhabdus rosea]